MLQLFKDYQIDSCYERLDFQRVHEWLASTYWSQGITIDKVLSAASNSSMVVGVYLNEVQVGYMRVVSDKSSFAYIGDVFVAEDHRGKGIAKAMIQFAIAHPEYQGLRRWLLATKDAHAVYASAGFIPLPYPERWMAFLPENARFSADTAE